jgi:hypothetical protein
VLSTLLMTVLWCKPMLSLYSVGVGKQFYENGTAANPVVGKEFRFSLFMKSAILLEPVRMPWQDVRVPTNSEILFTDTCISFSSNLYRCWYYLFNITYPHILSLVHFVVSHVLLFKPKPKCVWTVWCCVTSTDAIQLESFQQNSKPYVKIMFFPRPYQLGNLLKYLKLHTLFYRRHHFVQCFWCSFHRTKILPCLQDLTCFRVLSCYFANFAEYSTTVDNVVYFDFYR